MFDIHSHILYGVDDGAGNLSDSVEMAQLAAESGTKGLIATPHCNIPGVFDNYWTAELLEKLSVLRQELKKRNIPIEIYSGQEVFLSKKFETHLKNGEFITLNNSRYMLVELDFRTDEASMMSRLQRLSEYGYVPVVAHPERYGLVIENPDIITAIKSSGCLVQINRSSVLGDFGPYIKRTAQTILRNGLADFVASDAHSQYSRTPNLSDVHEYISENISYDYAETLLQINPEKVLKNEEI